MKRALTSIFVVAVNYYLLSFIVGIFLLLLTALTADSVNILLVFLLVILPLICCIIYQITRQRFKNHTIGELIIGCNGKDDILNQTPKFSVSRIPLFLLVIVTLILNGNLLDGFWNGRVYTISNTIAFTIIFLTIYYGLKNFFIRPDTLYIMIIAAGLLFIAFAFKKNRMLNISSYKIYYTLCVLWLLVGFYYRSKFIKPIYN